MLSIEECRKHIDGHEEYSDEEIRKIRDACHGFSGLVLDIISDKVRKGKGLEVVYKQDTNLDPENRDRRINQAFDTLFEETIKNKK